MCISCKNEFENAWDEKREMYSYKNPVVKSVMLSLKRKAVSDLAEIVISKHVEILMGKLSRENEAIFTSIPLTRSSLRIRGYNQSELLAKACARRMQMYGFRFASYSSLLERKGQQEKQASLSRVERLKNMNGAFEVRSNLNKNILLKQDQSCVIVIDDITTTGATLTEARRALISFGVKRNICRACAG